MRKLREVLRLRYELKLGYQQIGRSCSIAVSTVHKYLKRAEATGVTWPLPEDWDEARVEAALFPPPEPSAQEKPSARPLPDLAAIHEELQKNKHVTLQLLWEEYRQANPEGYRYSRFCYLYQRWRSKLDVVLRQEHKAGERMFVDWAGATIPVYDGHTGQAWQASLFVAALGASSYTWAEATRDQQMKAWLKAHVHAFEHFQGIPELAVPDNCKTGVSKAHRYDPDLNPTYYNFAQHSGFAILPARPHKPRDKAKVESAVQVAQRWIVAALRHRKFFSLEELNVAIRELLGKLNHRPFRKKDGTRASVWEAIDKPALKPLPMEPFDMSEWCRARVNIDYHVAFDATSTACLTTWGTKWWRSARHPPPLRSCTKAHGWPRICAAASATKPSPSMNIGPRATANIWSGRRRAWCAGRKPSDRIRRDCLNGSWRTSRIRNRAIAVAWASSDWPGSIRHSASKRPRSVPCSPARAGTRTSNRS